MSSAPQELRVVLLGKTGAGKSSLGNTLLGRDAFRVELSFSSVTFKCQWADAVRFGRLLQVTDTPGVSDTDRQEDEVLKEVAKSIAVASPGPHVIIMVLRCDKRFTQEEYNAYTSLKRLFGDNICNYLIVVFAGVDALAERPQEREKTLAQAILTAPMTLKEVLRDAGGRYCSVDNRASRSERDQQSHNIITAIQELVSRNGGAYFTNQMCEQVHQEVETFVQRRMETADHPTHEAALRDTRRDIAGDKAEPGFLTKLMNIVGENFLTVAGTVVGMVVTTLATTAAKAALSRCSVM